MSGATSARRFDSLICRGVRCISNLSTSRTQVGSKSSSRRRLNMNNKKKKKNSFKKKQRLIKRTVVRIHRHKRALTSRTRGVKLFRRPGAAWILDIVYKRRRKLEFGRVYVKHAEEPDESRQEKREERIYTNAFSLVFDSEFIFSENP